MKKYFGESWKTTIAGYLLGILLSVKTLLDSGETHWSNFFVAILIAILGKQAGDSSQVKEVKKDVQEIKIDNELKN